MKKTAVAILFTVVLCVCVGWHPLQPQAEGMEKLWVKPSLSAAPRRDATRLWVKGWHPFQSKQVLVYGCVSPQGEGSVQSKSETFSAGRADTL